MTSFDSHASADSDRDNLEQIFETPKVVDVASVEGKTGATRCRRNEKVNGTCAAGLASRRRESGEDPSVGSSGLCVERKWIKDGFRPLKAVLSSSTFSRIVGRVRSGREFGHRQRTDGEFQGKP